MSQGPPAAAEWVVGEVEHVGQGGSGAGGHADVASSAQSGSIVQLAATPGPATILGSSAIASQSARPTGSTTVTPTTHAHVRDREGGKCWHCGEEFEAFLHVAHQFCKDRHDRFVYFQGLGIVPANLELAHKDNLIYLCWTCHRAYDLEYPMWVVVPDEITLSQYLDHEVRDFERRAQAAAQGLQLPRTLPIIDKERVQYHHFYLDPRLLHSIPARGPVVKPYSGEPTTVILKAVCGLLQPCAVAHCQVAGVGLVRVGVEERLRTKVLDLVQAWSQPNPEVLPDAPTGDTKADDRGDGSGDRDENGGGGAAAGKGAGTSNQRGSNRRKRTRDVEPTSRNLRPRRGRGGIQAALSARIMAWREGVWRDCANS